MRVCNKFIESSLHRANPEIAEAVFTKSINSVVTQALGIVGIVLIPNKRLIFSIELVVSTASGCDKQLTSTIFIKS